MSVAVAPAALGEEDIALAAQRRELLLDRAHALANVGDPALEL
jgi:hypothetical protein